MQKFIALTFVLYGAWVCEQGAGDELFRGEVQRSLSVEVGPPLTDSAIAIRKALQEKTVMEFMETPLTEAFEYLAHKHKINIQLDKKGLDDAGIGSDTPVTRSLKDISLRSALRLMLKEFDLTWVVENEVMLITTVDEAGQRLSPHLYDVDDLVSFDDGVDYQSLIDTITTIVAPTTWDDVGGPGSVAPLHRMLVISQTQEVHEQIVELLTNLRQMRKARGDKIREGVAEPSATTPDPKALTVKVYRVTVPATPASPRSPAGGSGIALPAGTAVNAMPAGDCYLDELAKAIPALFQPESWERVGGPGSVFALPPDTSGTGQMLVRQTPEVHAQLQRFLNDLQATRGPDGRSTRAIVGSGGGGFF